MTQIISQSSILKSENQSFWDKWGPTIVGILASTIVAVAILGYTIYDERQEAKQLEIEKFNNTNQILVSIIEEHIVNKDSLDLVAFSRLVSNRFQSQKLYAKPSVYFLLTQAEYNIQNSKHLSFEKKVEYAEIISHLYTGIQKGSVDSLVNSRYPEKVKSVYSHFNEITSKQGKIELLDLINAYETEMNNLASHENNDESLFLYFLNSEKLLPFIISYAIALLTIVKIIKRNKSKKAFEKMSESMKASLANRLFEMEDQLGEGGLDEEQRKMLEDEIKDLRSKIRDLFN